MFIIIIIIIIFLLLLLLLLFVANVLAVSSRHEDRRTRMLIGHSFSCCTEENLVVLKWLSADCGAP